ncbi:MAG: hypothetical protein ACQETE_05760 [Bacteroidota bacterium]
MTTTASFVTRDCVVMGCDSLATTSKPMLDPHVLLQHYFNIEKDGSLTLKKNDEGDRRLNNIANISSILEKIPYNQQSNVTKIYHLAPANIGVLFAGIASIGDMSIKNIMESFLDDDDVKDYLKKSSYTISGTASRLMDFISNIYSKEFSGEDYYPSMEIIVSGYSKQYHRAEVAKIIFGGSDKEPEIEQSCKRGESEIVFGGQYDIIQRIVYGIDFDSYYTYRKHIDELFNRYHSLLERKLNEADIALSLPKLEEIEELNKLKKDRFWNGIGFSLANFSEQAAIDFIEFLIQVMIKSQQFSAKLPTVGGDIHMAIVTKSGGFRWLSKEEYKFQGNTVKKF